MRLDLALYHAAKPLLPRRATDAMRKLYQAAVSFLRYGELHMFQSVSLEISVYCNRTCSYCPNVDNATPREFMSEQVLEAALGRLREIRWSQVVDFIFYN